MFKTTLEFAEEIARKAHMGQKRWDDLDYITHPEAVVNLVNEDSQKIVAWLHDVLEDTSMTESELYSNCLSEEILTSLDCLTKRPMESYYNFILRCASDEDARIVKIADLTHNLSTLKPGNLRDKYLLAKRILENWK